MPVGVYERTYVSDEERFLSMVLPVTESGCWLWTGALLTANGYAKFSLGKETNWRTISGHRFSYKTYKGDIPEGLCVLHSCDVRSCVNPNHLSLGTYKENSEDAVRKGRNRFTKGRESSQSKLTEDDVIKIRFLFNKGKCSSRALGEMFGISHRHVQNIAKGKKWRHVKL